MTGISSSNYVNMGIGNLPRGSKDEKIMPNAYQMHKHKQNEIDAHNPGLKP